MYRSLPDLAIDRLCELNAVSPVPLVLHGGSGTPDDQIQAAVQNGICKLNIFADDAIAIDGADGGLGELVYSSGSLARGDCSV